MPIYNITVDDISPLFLYKGTWVDSNSDDPLITDYLNGTFHATQEQGASVSIKFNGSAVHVLGAKRGNHDRYTTTLDGQSSFGSGFAADPGLFQSTLFSAEGLDDGEHILLIEDTSTLSDRPFLDIDAITFTTGDGTNSTKVDIDVDDAQASVMYSSGWEVGTVDSSFFFENSYHQTTQPGASVTIPFLGSAVSLFGSTNTTHGTFSVSVDGAPATTFNGTAPTFRPQTLLFYASGLENAKHTLTLTNGAEGAALDFDRVTASCYGCEDSDAAAKAASKSHKKLVAVTAALVSVLFICILLLVFFLLWMRRRRRQRQAAPEPNFTLEKPPAPGAKHSSPTWGPPTPSVSDYSSAPRSIGKGAFMGPPQFVEPTRPPDAMSYLGQHGDGASYYVGMHQYQYPARDPYNTRSPNSDAYSAYASTVHFRSPVEFSPAETDAGPVPLHINPPPQYGAVFQSTLPVPPLPTASDASGPYSATLSASGPYSAALSDRMVGSSSHTRAPSRPVIPPIVTDLKTRALPPQPQERPEPF